MVDSVSRYFSDSEKTRIRKKWFGRNRPSFAGAFFGSGDCPTNFRFGTG
jgi:hypothetical protein